MVVSCPSSSCTVYEGRGRIFVGSYTSADQYAQHEPVPVAEQIEEKVKQVDRIVLFGILFCHGLWLSVSEGAGPEKDGAQCGKSWKYGGGYGEGQLAAAVELGLARLHIDHVILLQPEAGRVEAGLAPQVDRIDLPFAALCAYHPDIVVLCVGGEVSGHRYGLQDGDPVVLDNVIALGADLAQNRDLEIGELGRNYRVIDVLLFDNQIARERPSSVLWKYNFFKDKYPEVKDSVSGSLENLNSDR